MELVVDTSGFRSWLGRARESLTASAAQALGQSAALAVRHARATRLFKDGPNENRKGPHLRDTITRGQKGPWVHFIRASAKHALWVEEDTKPHRIEVKKRRALRFVAAGEIRFRRAVNHPGTKGTHFMAQAAQVGERALQDMLERAIANAFR